MSRAPAGYLLAVGGTDPSGGAGLRADVRSAEALGVMAYTVVTAVVAQNTSGVVSFAAQTVDSVAAQWDAALADVPNLGCIKIGMLGSAPIAWAVADLVMSLDVPVVVDPVLAGGADGRALSTGPGLVDVIRDRLAPVTSVLTPNVAEASALTGLDVCDEETAERAARILAERSELVLLKGGHLPGTPGDVIATRAGVRWIRETSPIVGLDVHGTGCHLASAIGAFLARGDTLESAVVAGRDAFARWIREERWRPGAGREILRPRRLESGSVVE